MANCVILTDVASSNFGHRTKVEVLAYGFKSTRIFQNNETDVILIFYFANYQNILILHIEKVIVITEGYNYIFFVRFCINRQLFMYTGAKYFYSMDTNRPIYLRLPVMSVLSSYKRK